MSKPVSSAAARVGPILLVDDYDDARLSAREALEGAGYDVIEARHGQQALDFLVNRPDEGVALIVLDLQMPVMDGWQLLEVLRCYVRLSTIPVIIASAYDSHPEQLRQYSVYGRLNAPYSLEKLIELVDACLRRANAPGSLNLVTKKQAG